MSTFNFVAASRTQIKNKKRKHPCHRGFLYKKEREKIIKCNKLRINRREIKTNKFNSRIKEEQCFIHTLNQELISIFIPKLSKRVSIRLFVH